MRHFVFIQDNILSAFCDFPGHGWEFSENSAYSLFLLKIFLPFDEKGKEKKRKTNPANLYIIYKFEFPF